MEKIFITLGVLFVVFLTILMVQQIILSIQESCEKNAIMRIKNSCNPNPYVEIRFLKNKVISLSLQLDTYRKAYDTLLQNKQEPIQGLYCRECKNNVSSIACKANVKCKLYEPK